MSIQGVQRAYGQAAADGYIYWFEAYQIERAALENDNTVNDREKRFLRDNYRPGLADPQSNYIFQQLISWGERSVGEEMDMLRQEKIKHHWFNDEYLEKAKPLLLQSTDALGLRMEQLRRLKSEVQLFQSDYSELGKQILLNSRDPIELQLAELRNFKSEAHLWNSEYQDIGKQLLQNSVDLKEARLRALERFRVEAGLWQRDAEAIRKQIEGDFYWDPRGEGLDKIQSKD